MQQISGGMASVVAGLIVIQTSSGYLERYDILSYVVNAAMVITIFMMFFIDKQVKSKVQKGATEAMAA